MTRTWALALVMMVLSAAGVISCLTTSPRLRPLGDGLDVRSLPEENRADYELFAQRCSKCHSLSRALDNGHIEDRFWEFYVERMRHQPGSGIAPEEVPQILRFLHFYSREGAPGSREGAPGTEVKESK